MKRAMIAVRNVDKQTFDKFRTKAKEKGFPIGTALKFAMEDWTSNIDRKPDPKNILKYAGFIKVPGNKKVRWSEEVDEILYGWKK